jgi:hypothetical protein
LRQSTEKVTERVSTLFSKIDSKMNELAKNELEIEDALR